MPETSVSLIEKVRAFGVGRRRLHDPVFRDSPPARLGVHDDDDEILCHDVILSTCNVPGCSFSCESILQFDNHYNSAHRYSCAHCKKLLPSPHLLDLHLQETHDSFFAVMAERRPSYCCYIEECKEKFATPEIRHEHCVRIHKLPKDFRFEQKPKNKKKNNADSANPTKSESSRNKIFLNNNKQKTFPKYTGRKFTDNKNNKRDVEMDISVDELKESLPK